MICFLLSFQGNEASYPLEMCSHCEYSGSHSFLEGGRELNCLKGGGVSNSVTEGRITAFLGRRGTNNH